MDLTEPTRVLGKDIIYNIADDGFLKTPLADIAGTNGVALEAVEKILGIIRKLDPPGVGSQNSVECLLMQLSEDDYNFELKKLLISRYLDRLQPNKLSDIAKELNIPLDELQQAVSDIKALKPHPAAGFSSEDIPYIVPDVIIAKIEDDYEIKIQSEYFPSLVISHYYRQIIADKNADQKTKDFIRDKINSANGLLQSIQLRKITLRQVAEQILRLQLDFFDKGIEHLKPFMMRDMAKKLGVHLSTISRVVANKYVQTPHGVFSMKFFFSSAAESSEGGACAQPVILAATRQIIENEDKKHPLSDIRIAQMLKEKNFTVARRTVALYREMLEIPNHSQRRKSK
jgi:RNA polymerase sigma-54 factor